MTIGGHALSSSGHNDIYEYGLSLSTNPPTNLWATTFRTPASNFTSPRILWNSTTRNVEVWGNQDGSILIPIDPTNSQSAMNSISSVYTVDSHSVWTYANSSIGRYTLDPISGYVTDGRTYGGSVYSSLGDVAINRFTGSTLVLGSYAGVFTMNNYSGFGELDTTPDSRVMLLDVSPAGIVTGAKAIEAQNVSINLPLAFAQSDANTFSIAAMTQNAFNLNGTDVLGPYGQSPYGQFLTRYRVAPAILDSPTVATDYTVDHGLLLPFQRVSLSSHATFLDTGTALSYDWESKNSLNGAWTDMNLPSLTYAVSLSDVGKYFRAKVTASNVGGATSTAYSDPIGPVLSGAPTLDSLDVTSGATTGGTTVHLRGSLLDFATNVTFDGIPATITARSETDLTVVTPPHAGGLVDVVVNSRGLSSMLGSGFNYVPIAEFQNISKSSVGIAGGETITVTGLFLQHASVYVDHVQIPVTSRTYSYGSETISFVTPSHAAGSAVLSIRNEAGYADYPGGLTYVDPAANNSSSIPFIPYVPTPTTDSTSTSTTSTTPVPAVVKVDNSTLRIKNAPTITKSGSNLVCDIGSYEYGDTSFAAAKPDSVVAHLYINGVAAQNQTITSGSTATWSMPTSPSLGVASCSVDVKQGKASITGDSLSRSTALDATKATWKSALAAADLASQTAHDAATSAATNATVLLTTQYATLVKKVNATYTSKVAALTKQKLAKKISAAKNAALLKAKKSSLSGLATWLAAQKTQIAATLQSANAAADKAHSGAYASADNGYGQALASGSGIVLLSR